MTESDPRFNRDFNSVRARENILQTLVNAVRAHEDDPEVDDQALIKQQFTDRLKKLNTGSLIRLHTFVDGISKSEASKSTKLSQRAAEARMPLDEEATSLLDVFIQYVMQSSQLKEWHRLHDEASHATSISMAADMLEEYIDEELERRGEPLPGLD